MNIRSATRRTAATLATTAAAVAATAGAAHAQTPISTWSDSYYHYGTATQGDCRVTAALSRATMFGWKVFAGGNVKCTLQHPSTSTVTYLKATNGVTSWVVQGQQTTFYNSFGMGDRWLYTQSFSCNPNLLYSAVVSTTVSGVGSFYATSGSPRRVC